MERLPFYNIRGVNGTSCTSEVTPNNSLSLPIHSMSAVSFIAQGVDPRS